MQGDEIDGFTQVYDISNDSWTECPVMMVPRLQHSCCTLGDMVYAFCGYDGQQYLSSIEELNAQRWINQQEDENIEWQQLLPSKEIQPRYSPLVTPIDSDKIIILGGVFAEGSISIFEVSTLTIENS